MDKIEKKKIAGNESKTNSRRKLLKSVVAGGGAATVAKMLPDQWARPIVDSVMLPSHAQTSVAAFGGFGALGPVVMLENNTQLAEQGFSEELLEFFTPAAMAAAPSTSLGDLALTSNSTGNSFLCGSGTVGNASTSVQMIQVQIQNPGTTPTFDGASQCLFGSEIVGGTYDGTNWKVDVIPAFSNVTTTVTLAQGVGSCSGTEAAGACIVL